MTPAMKNLAVAMVTQPTTDNRTRAIVLAIQELAEEVHQLKFPGDNRPLFEDGGPDPIGVSLEPLATAATGTNLRTVFGTGIASATLPALTSDGKLDISATPRGESLVETMRRQPAKPQRSVASVSMSCLHSPST